MEMTQVRGRTWMISGTTVLGVYVFENGQCLLIDSGAELLSAQKAMDMLHERGLRVWGIFNTHAHGDHAAGNRLFQQADDCRIFARPREAVQLVHPEIQAWMLYSASPVSLLQAPLIVPPPCRVTDFLQPGEMEVLGETFTIVDLPGHTMEHCGVITPDGVHFWGDVMLEEAWLEKCPYPYTFDVEKSLQSLRWTARQEGDIYCLAHGGILADARRCSERNRQMFREMMEWYLEELARAPKSREELLQLTLRKYFPGGNVLRYFLIQSSVAAFLQYFCEKKAVKYRMEDGRLLFMLREEPETARLLCMEKLFDEDKNQKKKDGLCYGTDKTGSNQ